MDDTIVALCHSLIEPFTDHINSIHPAIKFTREEENNGTIAMLDSQVSRDSTGKLSFTVYRKPTHTDQYLQFASNQPLQHKLGVIRTLYHRSNTICSSKEAKDKEIHHLKEVLSISGYTKSAWAVATRQKRPPPNQSTEKTKTKGNLCVPYVGSVTDAVARVIRKHGIQVHIKPFNTLRNKLVHPKDKISKEENSGVVYHIQCDDCNATYVGETERRLQKRVTEHHRSSSPVGQHLAERKYSFSDDNVKILHKESNWFRRGVAESIHITEEEPELNRDRGRHTLPAIYRELIMSRDNTSSTQSRDKSKHLN